MTLARARARTQEVAVRLALGASRARIIRQWLVEHVLVFVAASAVGTGLAKYGAVWVTNSIPAVNRQYLRNYAVLPIDGMTLTLALLTGAACGVVCGWLPAWASARTNVGADLREGSARTTAGRRGSRLRSALIVSEVAFTLALLVSAGLLIATARNVVKADVDFNPAALHTFELALDPRQHREPADVRAFYERVVAEIQRVPAVSQAAAGSLVPFGTSGSRTEFFIDGRPDTPPAETPQADSSAVTPAYASTLGLTLRRGRFLAAGDTADAPKVTVINELLASRHFAGRDPIGARLRFGRASTDTWTIVGVVADVRNYEVSDPTEPQVYLPFAQSPSRDATIVMRSSASPDVLLPLLRAAVARVDPQEPVLDPATMEQRIHRLTAGFQTVSTFVIFFGIVTLLLAGVGVYGVVSYTFAQRTREIGIRMALGARRVDVASLVFRQVRTLVLVGVVPGLALAWVLGEAMEAILFGVTPLDWRLYSAMTLLLTVTAAVAALLPARRAMRIDPTIALRYE